MRVGGGHGGVGLEVGRVGGRGSLCCECCGRGPFGVGLLARTSGRCRRSGGLAAQRGVTCGPVCCIATVQPEPIANAPMYGEAHRRRFPSQVFVGLCANRLSRSAASRAELMQGASYAFR